MKLLDLKGLNKAEVLAALFNNARYPKTDKKVNPMSSVYARSLLKEKKVFEVVEDRALYVDLSGFEFDPFEYDLYNGQGAAEKALSTLKRTFEF